jgi:hypothetical protein
LEKAVIATVANKKFIGSCHMHKYGEYKVIHGKLFDPWNS